MSGNDGGFVPGMEVGASGTNGLSTGEELEPPNKSACKKYVDTRQMSHRNGHAPESADAGVLTAYLRRIQKSLQRYYPTLDDNTGPK